MNTVLVEIRSEISAGTRGASMGQDALRVAGWNAGSDFFLRHESIRLPDQNDLIYAPVVHTFAKRIRGMILEYQAIVPAIRDLLLHDERFPVVLGSAHGTAGATIKAVKAAFPDDRVGVIWIDAHGDLHSPFTTPSGNMHGMPLAIALNEDNRSQTRDGRVVPPETIVLWNELKAIGYRGPAMLPQDIMLVAARDLEVEERHLIETQGIQQHHVRQIREQGFHRSAAEILEALKDCTKIYITFDVDSMDKSISVGTGTPVIDGLIPEEVRGLLRFLVRDPRVCCLEMVEINPTLDLKGNRMADVAFDILESVVNEIKKKR